MKNKRIPYTYFIKHKITGEFYYGVKIGKDANPNTFWVNYFTSSKAVKTIIERDGIDCFEYSIRKIFDSPEMAYKWEQRVISKIINKKGCLNSKLGFSYDPNKNRNIVGADGLTNYQRCALKAKQTMLNDIDKNGLNTYQRNMKKIYDEKGAEYAKIKNLKSAKTMKEKGIYEQNAINHSKYQNEILESGLTRAQETGKKISKKRKEMFNNGELDKPAGSKNPTAKNIHIFNKDGELMFECKGTFQIICNENNLPSSFFKKSYQNNGLVFPLEYKRGMSKKFYEENKQYRGWYALIKL